MAKKNNNEKEYKLRKAPFFIILAFLVIGILGVLTGEPVRVLEQAVQVCLSCIGIG